MAGIGGFSKAPIAAPAKGPAASKAPTPTGPPRPQGKTVIQVKAHTRTAPAPRPAKAAAPKPASSPLDPGLLGQAQALANTQTQAPITELQRQIAANNAQTTGTINLTGGYYNQLEPFVQQGVNQSGQIASGLNSTLAGINSGTQSQLQGIGQGALSSLLKYAPGSDANAATADLAAQIARQQGLAAQQGQTYQGFGANQGANFQQAANSNLGTFGLQGQEALRGIAQSGTVKNQPLVSKIAGLQAQRGALTATDYGKLQQQQVSNRIAAAGLHLKGAALKNTALNNSTRNGIAQQNADTAATRVKNAFTAQQAAAMRADHTFKLDQQKFGFQKAKDAYLRAHGLGPYRVSTAGGKLPKVTPTGTPTLTPLAQEKIIGEVNKLPAIISEMQQPLTAAAAKSLQKVMPNIQPGARLTEQQIRQLLAAGPNPAHATFDPRVVDAGYALAGYGYLTPKQITGLNKLGVIVGNRFRRGGGPAAQGVSKAGAGVSSGGSLF